MILWSSCSAKTKFKRVKQRSREARQGGWQNIPQGKDGTWIRMVITEVTKWFNLEYIFRQDLLMEVKETKLEWRVTPAGTWLWYFLK